MPKPDTRAALVRRAIDIIGARAAAAQLGLAESTVYALANGNRACSDAQIGNIRRMLIRHRQAVSDVVLAIREHEGVTVMEQARAQKASAP